MSLSIIFRYLLLFLIFNFFCACTKEQQDQNFVFILVDDMGWADLGYSGSTFYETPHIDDLSQNSIVFDNAYSSSPVCSPTRAAIMTGQHPSRVNITDWIPGLDPKNQKLVGPQDLNQLPLQSKILPEVLKENGYRTFFAGKWHLGGEGYYPEEQGFDYNLGGHERGQPPGGYYSPYKNPKLTDGIEGEYLTDRLTSESINFIEKSTEDPFFLFLSYYTVHTPIQPSKKHVQKFNRKLTSIEDNVLRQNIEGDGITTLNQTNADYASMVYALDENIGRLIKKLKEENLYDNTTIIFTSDNGGLTTLDTSRNYAGPTSVRPLRAGKGWLYEGGIKVPLLIKPTQYRGRNESSEEIVVSHDLYPTILSMANLESPVNTEIDGIDISPIFQNVKQKTKRTVYWDYPHYHGSGWRPGIAVREGDWKLIEFYESNQTELYNLKDDISEENDLSSEHPDILNRLKNKLSSWRSSLNIVKPKLNPAYE